MRAFTQHAGAARQRVAGAEQERQCRDRFGAESIFAAFIRDYIPNKTFTHSVNKDIYDAC